MYKYSNENIPDNQQKFLILPQRVMVVRFTSVNYSVELFFLFFEKFRQVSCMQATGFEFRFAKLCIIVGRPG